MSKYGVLVVDDSAVMRKAISMLIELHPDFYIVGKARNGNDALEKIKRLQPCIITMDLEMPELDGVSTIRQLVEAHRANIFVISNFLENNIETLQLGVADVISKESLLEHQTAEQIGDFHQRLLTIAKLERPVTEVGVIEEEVVQAVPVLESELDLVVIGSSTGGPAALQKLLNGLKGNFPTPILIIQHMPVGFTASLARRFDQSCALRVKEVEHNERLLPGTVYIAPAGIHTIVEKNHNQQLIGKLTEESTIHSLYKPSIDVALLSTAPILKDQGLVVILTGMGDDGLRGCKEVNRSNGYIITQTEESCVVYGMPKVVDEAGLSNAQLEIEDITRQMIERCMKID